MPNVLARREHNGAAPSTTLSSPIASGSDTTFVIASGTNWPTGSTGVFIVTIDRGQSTEERILCSSRTGTTVTVAASGRGYDGTTAQAHAVPATVEHTIAGVELDELNLHGVSTGGVHGVAGAVVGTTDTQNLTSKTLTSPTINTPTVTGGTQTGTALDSTSTLGGVSGATLATMPLGRVASATNNTAFAVSTTETGVTSLADISLTAVAGRRYKVTVSLIYYSSGTANNDFTLTVRDGGGSAPTNASTLLHKTGHRTPGVTSSNEQVLGYHFEVTGLSAGTHRLGLFAKTVSGAAGIGTANASELSTVTVEDIGT